MNPFFKAWLVKRCDESREDGLRRMKSLGMRAMK